MAGSIYPYQLADGTVRFSVMYRTSNGVQRRKRGFVTRQEAERWLTETMAAVYRGVRRFVAELAAAGEIGASTTAHVEMDYPRRDEIPRYLDGCTRPLPLPRGAADRDRSADQRGARADSRRRRPRPPDRARRAQQQARGARQHQEQPLALGGLRATTRRCPARRARRARRARPRGPTQRAGLPSAPRWQARPLRGLPRRTRTRCAPPDCARASACTTCATPRPRPGWRSDCRCSTSSASSATARSSPPSSSTGTSRRASSGTRRSEPRPGSGAPLRRAQNLCLSHRHPRTRGQRIAHDLSGEPRGLVQRELPHRVLALCARRRHRPRPIPPDPLRRARRPTPPPRATTSTASQGCRYRR
jgi:hypothetical protein